MGSDKEKGSSITTVAWVPDRELDFAEWIAAGRLLGGMSRCSQWGLGDWIRYGNTKFGERYSRAAKITGYDRQTLMNMVYVSSRFEISRRRENLSWSHHETVAALPAEEQEHWLDLASTQELSHRDLRGALRTSRADGKAVTEEAPEGVSEDTQALTCPHCGGLVIVPSNAPAVAA
jgi:hypothetical protein